MKQKLLFILGIISVALVFAITACSSGSLEKPDLTALNAKIAEAEAAKVGVLTATKAEDVAKGLKWVNSAVMTTFNKAIEDAKADRNAETQVEVDLATILLSAAIDAFNEKKQNGSKSSGFTQAELTALINKANADKDGVKVSVDGEDVSTLEFWVPQAEMSALDNAISAAQSATTGNIDTQYNALETALTSFNTAKQKGTGISRRTITITGLDVPDGTEIYVALFETDQINVNEQPEIGGQGEIQNKTVTFTLNNYGTLWTGSGSYYVAFQMQPTTPGPQGIYISKSKIAFSDANPSQTIVFSSFKKFVFKYTLGEFAEEMGITIPPGGITLDDWVRAIMDNEDITYAQMLEAGYIPGPLYKDEALTQEFKGSDKLLANTPIYSEFNLMGGGGDGPGPGYGTQIGTITGTITLTDVPSPAPRVTISVNGGDNYSRWWGDSRITFSGSGTVSNISWSIPIYGENGFSSPSTGNFRLYVQSSGSNRDFTIEIPTKPNIDNENANVGSLGTVSIKTITLSGTINLTINGQPVPYVEIALDTTDGQYWIGSTELNAPGTNAPWSITLPAINATVYLRVAGYKSRNNREQIFYRELKDENQLITVSRANVSGITINLGNIQTVTLSGTINVTYNGQRVPNVEIRASYYDGGYKNSWTQLSSPGNNAPWSMTMEVPASPQEVSFSVGGYGSNGGNWLFHESVTPASPVQISNQNVTGISLTLNYTD
jgi:hypothetical protein